MSFTYLGLKANLERHIVTAEETERQLDRLRQQTPRIAVIKDRPTQLGDEVVLDYAGFCGDVQFPGGTAENQTLVLGSGTFIPGFEEQLLDKVPGEKVDVNVTFPKQYHSADLAGKEAVFRCVVHEIRVKGAYELDDIFAKEVGHCDTLDDMRKKLTESLQAYANEQGEMDLQDKLMRQAVATLEMEVSEAEIDAAVDAQMESMKGQLAQQGLSIEMYCQFMSTDEATLRADARPEAEYTVRFRACVDRIVELEKLEPTQEEIAEALALICRQNRITMEQLKQVYTPELEQAVIASVLTTKAMGVVRNAAEVTEVK